MYYSRLSMLSNLIENSKIEQLDKFFLELTENTNKNITVSKVSRAIDLSNEITSKILVRCRDEGLLSISYGIKCPECGMLFKRIEDIKDIPDDSLFCYSCEREVDISAKDIEVLFSLTDTPLFNLGQQETKRVPPASPVVQGDSLENLLLAGNVLNNVFFSPIDSQYDELEKMYDSIFKETRTTKETGDKLEDLIIFLFNLSSAFRANGIRTTTNQVDCFVRNKIFLPYGIFNLIGGRFVIECKNEGKTPKGDYMSKIHSIIMTANGKGNYVKFGIIVSKERGPKTFRSLANKYYLANEIVVIAICGEEINELIKYKSNLFELIERKINEIIFDSTTDLKAAGLYKA